MPNLSGSHPPAHPHTWFVLVPADGPDRVLELFEEPDWMSAIMQLPGRIRARCYPMPVGLREARPGEIPDRPTS